MARQVVIKSTGEFMVSADAPIPPATVQAATKGRRGDVSERVRQVLNGFDGVDASSATTDAPNGRPTSDGGCAIVVTGTLN
ncbi:hypothetical protein [Actinoallomurus sp. NPDC052274]|uniref:hypothetical protein n=1 Tax=Actinoallomurus sp. NPDC052274 TaxID=3155420 RepID=UPI00343431F8